MQQTTAKLPAFFSRFQTKELVLGVKKSKITGEITFNENHFGLGSNHGLNKDEIKFV